MAAMMKPVTTARLGAFAALPVALWVALVASGPIAQPEGFHRYAGDVPWLGVPNFWNVVSNLPFALAGLLGLTLRPRGGWFWVFAGGVLVAPGSAWYHLAPDDARLVWDRIPIAIAFMGFLAALVEESLDERLGRLVLYPLLVYGVASVLWWKATGDLAPYVWVQIAPLAMVPLALAFFPSGRPHGRYMAYALACYAAAKLAELWDAGFHQASAGLMSGHVAKHLLAALGLVFLWRMLALRASARP